MLIALISLLYSRTIIATDVCVCRHVWMQIHLFWWQLHIFPVEIIICNSVNWYLIIETHLMMQGDLEE